MEITSLAREGSTLHSFLMLIALTLFYGTLLWLPFRGTAALLRWAQQALERTQRSCAELARRPIGDHRQDHAYDEEDA